MTEYYTWKCPACGGVKASKIPIWCVHSNGNNGSAYQSVKVGIVTKFLNPPYNNRFDWEPIKEIEEPNVHGYFGPTDGQGPFRPRFG